VLARLCLQHEELREKLRIVRTVLEQGGTFSGINRKVQLKPTKWSAPSKSDAPEQQQQQQQQGSSDQQQQQQPASQGQAGKSAADGTRSARSSSTGGSSAVVAASEAKPRVTELLLILKYGGVLTHAGRAQAEELGKTFRMVMYPRWVGADAGA